MPEKQSKSQPKGTKKPATKVADITPNPKSKAKNTTSSPKKTTIKASAKRPAAHAKAQTAQAKKPAVKKSAKPATKSNVKPVTRPATTKASKTTTKTATAKPKSQKPSSKTINDVKKQAPKPQKSAVKAPAQPEVPESAKSKAAETNSVEAKKPKKSLFSKVLACLLGLSSLFFIGMLIYLNMLPTSYLLAIIVLILVIAGGCGLLLWHSRVKTAIKVPVGIVSIIFSLVYLVAGGYIAQATGFLDNLRPQEYVSEQYYIIVKNDSSYTNVKELAGKIIGTFDEGIELYHAAIKELDQAVSADLKPVKSAYSLTEGLSSGEFDAILLSATHKSIIDEDDAKFNQNTKIIYTIKVKVKVAKSANRSNVNILSEPFTIYISGNDSYGDLSSRGLSDVNMLATVNPVTHEILLTSIPRDYYVQLHETTDIKDKLTHAGMYGVDMSIQTIEDLLDINIDYYVKINFPALIDIVDAIGGIDVYSDTHFTSTTIGGVVIPEGNVHMDGKMALAFARERKAYYLGDRHRVQNQRDVLNAIIKKVSSSTIILTKTNEILSSISSNLDTNVSKSEISSLVKLQLKDMPSWQVGEYMLDGTDLYTYTYTFNDQLRFVIVPNPESVQTAHDYITGILEGKTISELGIQTK